MKLKDLFEQQRVIEGDVEVPTKTDKLDYATAIVRGNFVCSSTSITSLKGSPDHVGGYFSCAFTKITSLEGAPSYIGDDFSFHRTKVRTLHNVHKIIKHIGRRFYLSGTTKSNILGVMMIKGLKGIEIDQGNREQKRVELIINKHLEGDRDVHVCQEEMLEAGLGAYAKL